MNFVLGPYRQVSVNIPDTIGIKVVGTVLSNGVGKQMTRDCPRCGGDGFVAGCVTPNPDGSVSPTRETCSRCDGEGTVRTADTTPPGF